MKSKDFSILFSFLKSFEALLTGFVDKPFAGQAISDTLPGSQLNNEMCL